MNPTEDLLLSSNQNVVSFDVQDLRVPCAQLKLQFRDILFNPKYTIGADQFSKTSNLESLSASVTDCSSITITLHSEDYKGHHALFNEEGIQKLRRIAEMLNSTNNLKDCVQMYIEHRKDVVNLIHMRLYEKLNVETVCVFKYWDELSEKIQRWIHVAKICIGTVFVIEKCFYEQIFGGLGTVEDDAADGFVHIVRQAAAQLFRFPDSLLASRRLPQRLEILLPLYQELTNLIPEVILIFNQDLPLAKAICNCATGIMFRLKKVMTKILSASEHHVLRELSMIPIPGGGIHPLTEYVIQYIDLIFVHRKALIELVNMPQGSNGLNSPKMDSPEMDQGLISLKHHLTRVIEFLLYNLKYKSNFYGQESLSHLFMMNNFHSVAEKIKSSQELKELIGIHFQMKLIEKVQLARTGYLKSSWSKICHFLRDEGSKSHLKCSFFPGSSTKAVKKKFKTFNRMFEDVHHTQLEWTVADEKLREKLRASILAKLIPAYNHFLQQFSCRIEKVKHPNRYIIYSGEDLETKVLNMFQCQVLKL